MGVMPGERWTTKEVQRLQIMKRQHCTYREIAKALGREETAVKRYWYRLTYKQRKVGGQTGQKSTICWDCINAVPNPETGAGCNWSRKLEPVDGWEAEKNEIIHYYGTTFSSVETCRVIKCPLFKES